MGAVVGWIRLGTGAAAHRFEGGTLRLTPLGASPASRQWQCTWSQADCTLKATRSHTTC